MPHPKIHQPRIVLVAETILMVMTLLVGVSVFMVMQRHAEELLDSSLQSSLQNRVQLTQIEIGAGFDRTMAVANRPHLIHVIQQVNAGATPGIARDQIDMILANPLLQSGLSAIAVYGKDGQELTRAGVFTPQPALTVPLNLPGRVQLIWDGQLLLRAVIDMQQAGQVVGKVMTETPLSVTMGALKDVGRLGETGELTLCAPLGLNMQCFPSTLLPNVLTRSQSTSKGDLLPMAHALAGKTGFVSTQDYRGQQVVAAYAPVGDVGLGMVLKMDSAELYAPVWKQLGYLIPLLLGGLVTALLSLRWLLTPLVLGLVRSEAQARELSASLRDSEMMSRSLTEGIVEGVITTTTENIVLEANKAALQLFGYEKSELIGRDVSELVPERHRRQYRDSTAALAAQPEAFRIPGRELRCVRKDGSEFSASMSFADVQVGGRRLFTGLILDITERKLVQARITGLNTELEQRVEQRTAQLEASNRDLQAFAYSVAHDLRQPFIAIGGFSGLLERMVEDERAKHYVARIKGSVRQAGKLTDALLALANLSRVELRFQEVDLSAIAHGVKDAMQHEDPARLASISIQSGLVVQADPMLLRLVMEELMGNAWKFTSRLSHTEISFGLLSTETGTAGVETIYVVRDNGEGFDMAHADKLFRSFQRLHAPQEFSGVGVGLAHIQRIIARHGGKIWAESALGEGASFFFTLGNARPVLADG